MAESLRLVADTLNRPQQREGKPHRMIQFQFLSWALLLLLSVPGSSAQCSLCVDGSTPDSSLTVGGVSCGMLADEIGNTAADSPDCYEVQLMVGYQQCGCPTFPDTYFCSMCPSGSFNITNPKSVIPLSGGMTCKASLFAQRSSSSTTCETIAAAAAYCGCPDATASSCTFCASGDEPTNSSLLVPLSGGSGGNLLIVPCSELADAAALQNSSEACSSYGNELIDARAYCGCPDATPPTGNCTLCGAAGMVMQDAASTVWDTVNNFTCQQAYDVAPFVQDDFYCQTLQASAAVACCVDGTAKPSASTGNTKTPAPAGGNAPSPSPPAGGTTPTSPPSPESNGGSSAVSAGSGVIMGVLLICSTVMNFMMI